jgi:hypothetical protein
VASVQEPAVRIFKLGRQLDVLASRQKSNEPLDNLRIRPKLCEGAYVWLLGARTLLASKNAAEAEKTPEQALGPFETPANRIHCQKTWIDPPSTDRTWKLIMRLFDSVKRLATEPRQATIASTLSFPHLDIQWLKDNRRLEERGQRNGSQGLPLADSDELDSVEGEIAAAIEQERDKGLKIYADRRRSYDSRSRALNLVSRITELEQIAATAQSQLQTRVHVGLDWLEQRQEYLRATRNEYEAFKKTHNLQRPSRHPRSHAWHIAILILLLLIETSLNGKFMAVGDELGYLGGIIQALVISLINLSVGFMVGLVLVRQWAHRNLSA